MRRWLRYALKSTQKDRGFAFSTLASTLGNSGRLSASSATVAEFAYTVRRSRNRLSVERGIGLIEQQRRVHSKSAATTGHAEAERPVLVLRSHNLISGANTTGGGKMRLRYQRGYLRLGHRKTGPDCWEFLWWDTELTGRRVRRKAVIGTVVRYPNIEDAWQASNGLRMSINEARNRQREQLVTVADLVDHYTRTELSADFSDGGKSHATRTVYKNFLARWVRPTWGSLNIRSVRTTAVEHWLRQLVRIDGRALAPSTKAKIRNVMSVLFNHAIRYEWLEQGKNPILLVRQGAQRQTVP